VESFNLILTISVPKHYLLGIYYVPYVGADAPYRRQFSMKG
jgi:hypothetical protein